MSVLVYDDFNGANGLDIAFHAPDIDVIGEGWRQRSANDVELDGSGALRFLELASGAWINVGTSDCVVKTRVNAGGADNRFVISARGVDDAPNTETNYEFIFRPGLNGPQNIIIAKRINGSLIFLVDGQFSFNSSQTYEFELSVIGSNLSAKIDGVEVLSATDSEITTGTYAGFFHGLYTNNALRVLDFEVSDTGGVTPTPQPVTAITAEQLTQASTLPISLSGSLTSIIAQQNEQANVIDSFIAQLVSSISASERHEAQNLTIEQTASQSINSIDAQELQDAIALTINQSAGQSVDLINAEQREQAEVLSTSQLQKLSAIIAEQVSDAGLVDVTNLQAVTMIIAEEAHEANVTTVQQYNGQLVTLITAQQIDEAETLLISEVGAIDILQSEQITEAQTVAFSQAQRISTITAEQLTEAQILSVLSSGDNTDLSGLRLIPITAKYQIAPTNTTRYTLTKV